MLYIPVYSRRDGGNMCIGSLGDQECNLFSYTRRGEDFRRICLSISLKIRN